MIASLPLKTNKILVKGIISRKKKEVLVLNSTSFAIISNLLLKFRCLMELNIRIVTLRHVDHKVVIC